MGTSFENGISVSFWAFLENNASIFYLKTGFPIFWAYNGNLWKIMSVSSIWKWDFRCFFGLWCEPLENNTNIFFLKTGFPLFFLACDGNLWKIISIFFIWKRNFRVFSGLVMEILFENGISVPCLFGLFWKIMPASSIWKRDFLFWAYDGNLWKIIPISSIWKRDFLFFLGLWWEPHLKHGNPVFKWGSHHKSRKKYGNSVFK